MFKRIEFKAGFIFFCALFYAPEIYAQNIDLQEISEITIEAERADYFTNAAGTTLDSLFITLMGGSKLAQCLQAAGPANIKTYGAPGSLATANMRGAGAENTSVKLNGFQLNSITTGSMDLSLLPAEFFEEIRIFPGAESGLFGSGTFGGAVQLNSFPDVSDKKFETFASAEAGSYGNQKYTAGAFFSGNRTIHKTSAVYQSAENNFPFINRYKIGHPKETRQHNAYRMYAAMHSSKIKFSGRDKLEISGMAFSKEMQIPETAASAGESMKMQRDSGIYITLRYQKLLPDGRLSIGTAGFADALNYTDRISENPEHFSVNSNIKALRLLNDVSYRRYISAALTAETGFSLNWLNADSNNFPDNTAETNGRAFAALKYTRKFWILKASGGAEISQNYSPQPVISAGLIYKILPKKFLLSVSVSNQFRRPTFNEKYWLPGGNPNIMPEKALNTEGGFNWSVLRNNKYRLTLNNRVFYTKIHDMIRWIPVEGIWTAVNNREINNRGFETDMNFVISQSQFKLKTNLAHYYTRSSIASEGELFPGKKAYQLMYVPKHRFKFFALIGKKYWQTGLSLRHTGRRHTTDTPTLNNELPSYLKADLIVKAHYSMNAVKLSLQVRAENITDTYYESIKAFPAPGRMIFISLTISYKQYENIH